MAFLRFFKVPKHQKYQYNPRYWDPQKEELEERLRQVKLRQGTDTDAMKARISGSFKRNQSRRGGGFGGSANRRSNFILILVVVVLLVLSYLFLVYYLPQFMEAFEGTGG